MRALADALDLPVAELYRTRLRVDHATNQWAILDGAS